MPQTDSQYQFAAALLDPTLPVPAGVVGPDREPSQRRFAVYVNNVVVGLSEVLKDAFPAVRRLVGADFFLVMAIAYVRAHPPQSPALLEYGRTFAAFIEGFAPAASVPYLADVARIEWAWKEAYHAKDESVLDVSDLRAVPSDALPSVVLRLHPSLRLVRSLMPAFTIWRMNVADGVPEPVALDAGSEDVLVIRPDAEVEVRSVPPGGLDFLTAISNGCTVAEATEFALTCDPRFDLAEHLVGLIEAGAFASYHFDTNASSTSQGLQYE
jgi:hypothetical protein